MSQKLQFELHISSLDKDISQKVEEIEKLKRYLDDEKIKT